MSNNNAIDYSSKSPRRDVPMVEVEVESVTMQCLPNGWLVNPGKSRIMIYEDQVPEVEALTRTEQDNDLYKRAQSEFEGRLMKYAEDEFGGDLDKATKKCPFSVESVFLSMNQSLGIPHVKPLKSMKILKDGLPPPAKKDSWDASAGTAKIVADVLQLLFSDDTVLDKIADRVNQRKTASNRKGN